MKKKNSKLGAVTQNVILGSITGIMVGYNLRMIFSRIGTTDLIWIMFFLMGPVLGYLSGKERQRLEKLKNEKLKLKNVIIQ